MQESLISKLSAGSRSGRASSAEKQLEKMKEDGLIEKPFEAKKRSFSFPTAERLGRKVLSIGGLTHGYGDRTLFKNASLEIEKGERVAIIGVPSPTAVPPYLHQSGGSDAHLLVKCDCRWSLGASLGPLMLLCQCKVVAKKRDLGGSTFVLQTHLWTIWASKQCWARQSDERCQERHWWPWNIRDT